MRPTRRAFLRAVGRGAATLSALPLVEAVTGIEAAFADDLGRLARKPGALSAQELAPRYMLADDVVYLNHASIGTVPRSVHSAHLRYLELCETNPWLYMWGGAWEEAREATRASVAGLLGADADDVALTHNTTEGFNLLAQGLPLGPGDEILFTSLNHDGASVCWEHMAARRGFSVRRVPFPVADAAEMTGDDVVAFHRNRIRPETKVLVLPHLDNAVGIRHPLAEMVAAARDAGVEYVAVDGAQTVGMIPLDLPSTGVDFYAGSPHKWVQAPKGLGLLYMRPGVRERVEPMWVTWGQRSWEGTVRIFEDYGTRNLPEVIALGDAADLQATLDARGKVERYRTLHRALREATEASPGVTWRSPRAWNDGGMLVALEVRGRSSSEVGAELREEHGVILRSFGGDELNTLRVAPNLATSAAELERFVGWLDGMAR